MSKKRPPRQRTSPMKARKGPKPSQQPSLDSGTPHGAAKALANIRAGQALAAKVVPIDPSNFAIGASKLQAFAEQYDLMALKTKAEAIEAAKAAQSPESKLAQAIEAESEGLPTDSITLDFDLTPMAGSPEPDEDDPEPVAAPRPRGRPRKGGKAPVEIDRPKFLDTVHALVKASTDLRYFIESFLWIEDKDTGELKRFILNPEQRTVVQAMQSDLNGHRPVRIIILKPRQIGVTTLVTAVNFWASVFTPNYSARLVLDKRDKAEVVLRMAKRFRDLFPPEACLRKGYDAKKSISVDNSTLLSVVDAARLSKWEEATDLLIEAFLNPDSAKEAAEASKSLHSMIQVESADKMAGRSATIRSLHASEVAFWPGDPGEAFNGLKNSVPHAPKTFVVIESTAYGRGGYFYQAWKKAERGENGYRPMFFPWFAHPEYTATPNHERISKWGHTTLLDDITPEELKICRAHGIRGPALAEVAILKDEQWTEHPQGGDRGVTIGNLLWRRRTIRDNCDGQLEQFMREYPCTPEEAFVAAGADFFPAGVQQNLLRWADDYKPIAQGDFAFDGNTMIQRMNHKRGTPLPKATFVPIVEEKTTPTQAPVAPDIALNLLEPVQPDSYGASGTSSVRIPLISIWEWPVAGRLYVLGGDVSQGLSPTKNVRDPDYSVLYVMDAISGKVCARLRGRIQTDLLAEKAALLGRLYNDAMIGIEANPAGGGMVVNKMITEEFDHWNVMYHKDMASASGQYTDRIGWYTHAGNRTPMLNTLLVDLSAGRCIIGDEDFRREAAAFIRDPATGKPTVSPGEFDDCVLALSITNMLRREPMGMTAETLDQLRQAEEAKNAPAVGNTHEDQVFQRMRELDAETLARQKDGGGIRHPRLGVDF